jgi:hypothetical protein
MPVELEHREKEDCTRADQRRCVKFFEAVLTISVSGPEARHFKPEQVGLIGFKL